MLKTLSNLTLKSNKVIVRVDFNVPLNENLQITDDTRIAATIPTLQYILDQGAALIVMSHMGRPKGKVIPELSLVPCAKRLSELLNRPVLMAKDCIGGEVNQMASSLKPGEVLLLENLRFHAAEEKPDLDPNFAKSLADLADVYVNDAFGTAHRKHSSTFSIAKYFPGSLAPGFLLEKEMEFLGQTLADPKRPFCAIIGGAKVSSKIGVLKALVQKVDHLLIGGGMAFTFFKAQGISIGNSICEDDFVDLAKEILDMGGDKIILPRDIVIADDFKDDAGSQVVVSKSGVPDGFCGMDIGENTIEDYQDVLKKSKTILWNGPLGVFEFPRFAEGTQKIAKILSSLDATTIVGGGDSVAAVKQAGLQDKITHISTGGGASLEYIEFGTLPGLEALKS